jgi:hypothetical protein
LELFAEDQAALGVLPARPFDVVSFREYVCDKYGKVLVDGVHAYSVAPEAARMRVVGAFRAHTVEFSSLDGKPLARHARLFGKRRAERIDHARMMTALVHKPGAWRNSELRAQKGASAGREFLDSLPRPRLAGFLQAIRTQAKTYGLGPVQEALDLLAGRGREFSAADLAVAAGRVDGFGLGRAPDTGPDLGGYDQILGTQAGGPR